MNDPVRVLAVRGDDAVVGWLITASGGREHLDPAIGVTASRVKVAEDGSVVGSWRR